jgi:predicted HTH transcriptional regulator
MDVQALQELVKRGEGQNIEFKRKAAFPDKIVREMVAFANSEGGRVFVGVDDDGSIPGLKFAEEEKYSIDRAISSHSYPSLNYKTEIVAVSRKRAVLIYTIFENRRKPIYFLQNTLQRGKAYLRVRDKSIQASREMKEILKGQNRKKGRVLHYGDKEKILMEYLGDNHFITVEEFSNIAGIPRRVASRTLVLLVLTNVLDVQAGEKEDQFLLKSLTSYTI